MNFRPLSCLKIQKIELVIIDVVPNNFRLLYEKEVIKQNSDELRTRILSVKAGKDLPMKLIELVKNFYELSVTSVTNIPMKVSDLSPIKSLLFRRTLI